MGCILKILFNTFLEKSYIILILWKIYFSPLVMEANLSFPYLEIYPPSTLKIFHSLYRIGMLPRNLLFLIHYPEAITPKPVTTKTQIEKNVLS